MTSEDIYIQVTASQDGQRLDHFLSEYYELSRNQVKQYLQSHIVEINGARARKGSTLRKDQWLKLDAIPETVIARPNPKLSLVIVEETPDFVIVDKPLGMPTHPIRPKEADTLANGLVARYPEMSSVGYHEREPGLLHRLDNGTSGLILAARTQAVFVSLQKQLVQGQIDKRYQLRCHGHLIAPREIRSGLEPGNPNSTRMQVSFKKDLPIRKTEILNSIHEVDETKATVSRATVRVHTAARHQIRAHLAYIGHPLLGDTLYGKSTEGEGKLNHKHHILHASEIKFQLQDKYYHVEKKASWWA